MRLPVTDKFLLDFYSFVYRKFSNTTDFMFGSYPVKSSIIMNDRNPVIDKYRNDMSKKQISNLIGYLKRKNYIKSKNLENKKALIITKNGIDRALKVSFMDEEKKKRKDGRWTMLIFDVPERHRKSRNLLRNILKNLGYKMFQQSVWISPYDTSIRTEKLLQLYSLDNYVKIFLIEEIQ